MKSEVSTIRKSLIRQLNTGRLEKIVKAMPDKEYVEYCLATLEYVMPKLARTELTGEDGNQITIKVVRE